MREAAAQSGQDADLFGPMAAFLGGYRPLPGAADEMVDEAGAIRGHWRGFVDALRRIGHPEILRRFDATARHLRDAGVFYRVYDRGEGAEHAWPLNYVPVIIAAEEWGAIAAGMVQRAELMDRVLADAYGPQTLVAEGVLPAAVFSGSPEFLRPLVGVKPRGGRFLRLYAADLGRGPDGRWWVVGDRAQAPSGAGYALENRIALTRTLPGVFRGLEVERLAGFFQAFRRALSALAAPGSAGACLLTPGPLNETYFEHAYLARYLGFPLVEGSDLAVREDGAYLRTVEGLRPVDVLVRRLDGDFADPLELNAASEIGAPGLVQAVRAGRMAVANALGSGLVESRALLGFLPRLSERLLGESLKLPNVATWWCGQAREREEVLARLDELAIAPAFTANGDGPLRQGAVAASSLSGAERDALAHAIRTRGVDLVGQEIVRLSTTPIWRNQQLIPRPFTIRVFVAATEDGGWTVMPGGFCRISTDPDARVVSMQQGGLSADVWVLGANGAEPPSLLAAPESAALRRGQTALTSRAADNLFWLGRYLERTEATLRLVRAALVRASERDASVEEAVNSLIGMLRAWGAAPGGEGALLTPAAAAAAALGRGDPGSGVYAGAPALMEAARRSAAAIRDRLSPDAWRTINDLAAGLAEAAPVPASESDYLDRADRALRLLAAFSGFAQENMTRTTGWRFLEIGRRLERALCVGRFVAALAVRARSDAAIDALLELGDSQITYAQRYFVTASRPAAIDLLMLDATNPRSCAFQIYHLRRLVERLPGNPRGEAPTGPLRAALRLETDLSTTEGGEVDEDFVTRVDAMLLEISETLSARYLTDRGRPASARPREG